MTPELTALVARLEEQWRLWDSPVDHNTAMGAEQHMAVECHLAAEALQEQAKDAKYCQEHHVSRQLLDATNDALREQAGEIERLKPKHIGTAYGPDLVERLRNGRDEFSRHEAATAIVDLESVRATQTTEIERIPRLTARVEELEATNLDYSQYSELKALRATLATQAAEIERLKLHYKGVPHDWVAQELYDDQAATIEALRKDVDRYWFLCEHRAGWLSNRAPTFDLFRYTKPDRPIRRTIKENMDHGLDAAIDAALMTERGQFTDGKGNDISHLVEEK